MLDAALALLELALCLLFSPFYCIRYIVLEIFGRCGCGWDDPEPEASNRDDIAARKTYEDIAARMTYEDYLRLRSVYDSRERFQELLIACGCLQTSCQEVLETLPPPTSPEATVVGASVEEELCCAFCMEAFLPQDIVSLLQCQHIFHAECIADWMSRPRATANSCPLCRACFAPTHV